MYTDFTGRYHVHESSRSFHDVVAAPAHLSGRAPVCAVTDLPNGPLLAGGDEVIDQRWVLQREDHEDVFLNFTPRLASRDLQVLLEAALDGIGIALLPEIYAHEALATGRLVHILPAWRAPDSIVHLVFTSRRTMHSSTRYRKLVMPRTSKNGCIGMKAQADSCASTPSTMVRGWGTLIRKSNPASERR